MNKRSTTLLTMLGSAVTAALTTAAVIGMPASAHDGGKQGAQALGDPDYGVCRGLDSRCYHNWGNFDLSKGVKVLVYSRTAGPRHANLGPALGPGLNPPLTAANVAQSGLVELGKQNGFTVDWTEDVTQLAGAASLFKYNAVIFMSTTRDTLDDSAQTALRQYIRGGGGFVGIHNAFGTEYNWPWYEGLLGGANYYDHGPAQAGVVQTVDRNDVSTKDLPNRWAFTDEWYNLVPFPSNVRFLAKVDEKSLAKGVEGSMGHPGPRERPPGGLVPVLRRRPVVGDHARPRELGVHQHVHFGRCGVLPDAGRERHQVRRRCGTVLPLIPREPDARPGGFPAGRRGGRRLSRARSGC
jgi:hypothetical protein